MNTRDDAFCKSLMRIMRTYFLKVVIDVKHKEQRRQSRNTKKTTKKIVK